MNLPEPGSDQFNIMDADDRTLSRWRHNASKTSVKDSRATSKPQTTLKGVNS